MRALVIALVGLVACARDVAVRFPAPDSTGGTLILKFGSPASDVSVSIDGWLVVEDEHTSRVTIDGVPIGTREITIAANGADRQIRIWVSSDHPTTVPIGIPDGGMGFLKSVLGSLIGIIAYSLLH